MSIILGYILAILMGIVLGSIGAGGSILSIPIFVYLFHIPPLIATSYSLLTVGLVSLVGAATYLRRQQINWQAIFLFAPPATLMVFFSRIYLLPQIPETLFGIEKGRWIMLLFSLLMITIALLMKYPLRSNTPSHRAPKILLILGSAGIGLITGIVGAGGGFLIVPSLMFLFRLPTPEAIGSSLAIITFNTLLGLSGDLFRGISLNISLIAPFLILTFCGLFLGTHLNKNSSAHQLKKAFAYFTLALGLILFSKEIYSCLNPAF